MEFVVVDTDVVSFYFKNDPRSQPFVSQWSGKTLVISFMTFAELQLWGLLRKWDRVVAGNFSRFSSTALRSIRSTNIFCQLWAAVVAETRTKGRRLQVADAWIAATALAINAPLATHNAIDFGVVSGLQLLAT